MRDTQTASEQMTAVVKAVYPLISSGGLSMSIATGRVVIEECPQQSELSADLGVIVGTAIGQSLVALTMVNNGRRDRAFFLAVEKSCRKAMDALQETVASDED